MGLGVYGPPHDECREIKLVIGLPGRHAQSNNAAELFSVLQAVQSWGLGKRPFVLQSDYVMAGMRGNMQQWKQQQRFSPKGHTSNVDLWVRRVELMDRQHELLIFAKLGPRVKISVSLHAEELASEALCSHPLQARERVHKHDGEPREVFGRNA